MKHAALLLLSGCMMMPAPVVTPAPEPPDMAGLLGAELVDAANVMRAEHGAPELVVDSLLSEAAQDFAFELARRRMLTHTSHRDGYETLMDRLDRAGAVYMRAGENLASLSTRAAMPQHAIRLWLDSPGHRKNLLDPAYTHTGTGAARGVNNVWYFVQVYGTPPRR